MEALQLSERQGIRCPLGRAQPKSIRIRLPQIDSEHEYNLAITSIQKALFENPPDSNWIVEVPELGGVVLSLAAVLVQLKEELQRRGGNIVIVKGK